MSLTGKYALITGSSRGIGRGTALRLAEKGINIAINYRQNEAAAHDTLAKVRERGADGFVVQADVSKPEEVSRLFSRVQSEFGRLDIFVANALGDLFSVLATKAVGSLISHKAPPKPRSNRLSVTLRWLWPNAASRSMPSAPV